MRKNRLFVCIIISLAVLSCGLLLGCSGSKPTKLEVEFEMNGYGEQVETVAVDLGGRIAEPYDPVSQSYVFGGWYADENCTELFDFNEAIAQNTVVYAKWLKAKDALSYLGSKYTTEQTAEIFWQATDYKYLAYAFSEVFSVERGFEMQVYADEALTDIQDQDALEMTEGNNDYWIVVFKEGRDKTDSGAHIFKFNVYKPVTVIVYIDIEGSTQMITSVKEGSFVNAPTAPALPSNKQFEGWFVDPYFNVPYEPSVLYSNITLYAKIGENPTEE
ncbi:MAG: InlB B-repeat-containing protein [Clostridia bacterium]|nr:InlB B-repeat-containing protein [Clostridia bacterium]